MRRALAPGSARMFTCPPMAPTIGPSGIVCSPRAVATSTFGAPSPVGAEPAAAAADPAGVTTEAFQAGGNVYLLMVNSTAQTQHVNARFNGLQRTVTALTSGQTYGGRGSAPARRQGPD